MSLTPPGDFPPVQRSHIADWPIERVAALKQGHRVAVILPARDEAATVGDIVSAIAREHMAGDAPLVDGLVVVDSCSTDGTAEIAAAAGARIVTSLRPGKGEAMWRGLQDTDADLVVYLDADLAQFNPEFVPALMGPLLADPAIQFVKASYQRPMDATTAAGGGRVTELMARPLLNAFWPELATIAQPLSGEYAARRSLLSTLRFRCGYGVDIALLIDTVRKVGVAGITDIDLGVRHHRSSDLPALGRMASEVLHTVFDRLSEEHPSMSDVVESTTLLQPTADSPTGWERHEIDRTERPPLLSADVSLPESYAQSKDGSSDRPDHHDLQISTAQ